jgi:pyridoxal phosphate enzyme (YggS family)
MSEIAENLFRIQSEISAARERAGALQSVELIAVSKTFPIDAVREACEAGHLQFGESRIQEAEPKVAALPGRLVWHFIGRVQRNKVRKILQHFTVVHGVDSLRLATYMDDVARELAVVPQVFLQVNIGAEPNKGGFAPELLRTEMEELLALRQIEIVGLMCIPPAAPDPESARQWFIQLRQLRDQLEISFQVKLPSLSMGMSGDYRLAVEEGATHVRVGSAIFGKRSYRVDGELG